jgi:hypothetical protein
MNSKWDFDYFENEQGLWVHSKWDFDYFENEQGLWVLYSFYGPDLSWSKWLVKAFDS